MGMSNDYMDMSDNYIRNQLDSNRCRIAELKHEILGGNISDYLPMSEDEQILKQQQYHDTQFQIAKANAMSDITPGSCRLPSDYVSVSEIKVEMPTRDKPLNNKNSDGAYCQNPDILV